MRKLSKELIKRSSNKCELCGSEDEISAFEVSPAHFNSFEDEIVLCNKCNAQIEGTEEIEVNHWRFLNDTIWSEVEAVKVQSYRMLKKMSGESWTQDLLDMMYMEEDILEWANKGVALVGLGHVDSNGVALEAGDTVILIKSLDVKGSSLTAKRGTAVRRISLVADNPEHIEGKVEGQSVVILTKFVKKSK
jgi:protein PhnA